MKSRKLMMPESYGEANAAGAVAEMPALPVTAENIKVYDVRKVFDYPVHDNRTRTVMLVFSGSALFEADGSVFTAQAGDFVDQVGHTVMKMHSVTSDFDAVAIDIAWPGEACIPIGDDTPCSEDYIFEIHKHHTFPLGKEAFIRIASRFAAIARAAVETPTMTADTPIVTDLFTDISATHCAWREALPEEERRSVRQIRLMQEFSKAVKEHANSQRTVNFYGKYLGTTPQHLNLVSLSFTGHNARTIVARVLARRITDDLINSDTPLSELARRYNFAREALFIRFYLGQTGSTPADVRRRR